MSAEKAHLEHDGAQMSIDWDDQNIAAVEGAAIACNAMAIRRFGEESVGVSTQEDRNVCPECHDRLASKNKWVVVDRLFLAVADENGVDEWVCRVRGGYCPKCRVGVCLAPEWTPAYCMEEEDE